MDWYEETAEALVNVADLDPNELSLSDDLREELLDLARIASHQSGARINAPFLCYALGFAVAKGASLDDLARVIRQRAGEGT